VGISPGNLGFCIFRELLLLQSNYLSDKTLYPFLCDPKFRFSIWSKWLKFLLVGRYSSSIDFISFGCVQTYLLSTSVQIDIGIGKVPIARDLQNDFF